MISNRNTIRPSLFDIMKGLRNLILIFTIVGSYVYAEKNEGAGMKTLTIRWQRLVDEKGKTCERCAATEKEVRKARQDLEKSLTPFGMAVALEEEALDPATCAEDISESNRIWINNKSLEDWLGASVGESSCASCCAELGTDVECRTVIHEGETYETIPTNLIIKAGLIAAAQLLSVESNERCCDEKPAGGAPFGSCCPKDGAEVEE